MSIRTTHNLEHRTECVISQLSESGDGCAAGSGWTLAVAHGHIPFGYIFHLFTVRRRW